MEERGNGAMTDWQPIKTTPKEQVLSAMELLLTAKQINYVKSKTFAGPSKIAVIRRLINIGIQVEVADGSERFRDYVLKNIWPQVRDQLQAILKEGE